MTSKHSRRFVKSSFSGGNGGDCVEWAVLPDAVYVRDSKDRDGAELVLTHTEWAQLTASVASGTPHPSVTATPTAVRLRDLTFTPSEWTAFTQAVRAGECAPAQ